MFCLSHFLSYFIIYFFVLIFFNFGITFAQNPNVVTPRLTYIIRPIVQMDFRQSFVKDSPIQIYGGNLGARIGDFEQITLGYYTLTSNSKQQIVTRNRTRLNLDNSLNIWFVSLNFTHYIVNNRYWEMGFPLEVGYGNSIEDFKNPMGRTIQTFKNDIYPVQAGILVHLKLTKWIGIKGALGFRHTITPSGIQKPTFTEDFNGLYYSYGAKLYLDNIYNSILGRKKKTFFFPKNIE